MTLPRLFAALALAASAWLMSPGCAAPAATLPLPPVASTAGSAGGDGATWYSPALPAMLAAAGVDVASLCPSGPLTVQDGPTFIGRLTEAYGGWVWYDSTVEVSCPAGSAELRLSPAQMRLIAAHPAALEEASRFAPGRAGALARALGTQPAPRPVNLARSPLGTPRL